MNWADIIVKGRPVETPSQTPAPQVLEASDFEIETAFMSSGVTKNERWAITETFKERGIKPTAELVWLWAEKLRCRERIGA